MKSADAVPAAASPSDELMAMGSARRQRGRTWLPAQITPAKSRQFKRYVHSSGRWMPVPISSAPVSKQRWALWAIFTKSVWPTAGNTGFRRVSATSLTNETTIQS